MTNHIIQSEEWGKFKSEYGTKTIRVDGIQYTIHRVPFTNNYYAYCPKVNPRQINWENLKKSLEENNCFNINFDVPHVLKEESKEAQEIFESNDARKSPKNTFTKNNILLDLSKGEESILKNMHKKHRYNIRYAKKKGVKIREAKSDDDFNIFWNLLEETSKRQKFLSHPKEYYKKAYEILKEENIAHILIAEYKNEPLASWMLFVYDDVLYYPYGGSSTNHKNLYASNLIGWEAIRLGLKHNCKTFDMWGACNDLNDINDPEWGFTNFKLKFGGKYVEYMDSYDYVLNPTMYHMFNMIYPKAMAVLRFIG